MKWYFNLYLTESAEKLLIKVHKFIKEEKKNHLKKRNMWHSFHQNAYDLFYSGINLSLIQNKTNTHKSINQIRDKKRFSQYINFYEIKIVIVCCKKSI